MTAYLREMETYGIRVDLGNELEAVEVVEATATDDSNLDGLFVDWFRAKKYNVRTGAIFICRNAGNMRVPNNYLFPAGCTGFVSSWVYRIGRVVAV